jgi:hypothetical protein
MNQRRLSDPTQFNGKTTNAKFLAMKDPLSGNDKSALLTLPKDPSQNAGFGYRNWGMEIGARFTKPLGEHAEHERLMGMMRSEDTFLCICRGWGELFHGSDDYPRALPLMLFQNMSQLVAQRTNIGTGPGGLGAKTLLSDTIDLIIADGTWPGAAGGGFSLSASVILADGRYSIASIGDFAAYAIEKGVVRRIMGHDKIVIDGKVYTSSQVDISDYAINRKSAVKEITAEGVDMDDFADSYGTLGTGDMIIFGSPGFGRRLWVKYDKGSEAVLDTSGCNDISTLLSGGLLEKSAAWAIRERSAEDAATILIDEVSKRMDNATSREPFLNDGWALIPDASAATLIAYRKAF